MVQTYSLCVSLSVVLFFFINVRILLHNPQLRGFLMMEKNQIAQHIIDYEHAVIYKAIAQRATIGKTKASFTIMCETNENPPRSTISEVNNKIMVLQQHYNISLDYLRSRILDKLKQSFPMSTLYWENQNDGNPNTTELHNCLYYTLIW